MASYYAQIAAMQQAQPQQPQQGGAGGGQSQDQAGWGSYYAQGGAQQ